METLAHYEFLSVLVAICALARLGGTVVPTRGSVSTRLSGGLGHGARLGNHVHHVQTRHN
jgi:hypothetical protein